MRKIKDIGIINAISNLQGKGYSLDFSVVDNKLFCAQIQCYLVPEEFEVRESFHFWMGKAKRLQMILLALESNSQPLKGILLSPINWMDIPQ